MSDRIAVRNQDLVLRVSKNVDPKVWEEGLYYQFVDRLCGNREYQKQAIFEALRFMLGEQYEKLENLAFENWQNGSNEALLGKFKTYESFKNSLVFPDKLAGSLDLATGTGKSYVLYGLAAIMLAEGKVDQVLVLCPSTTIENGLTEKFKELATRKELVDLLNRPAPKIINGSESVIAGSICIENYHQILENATSSIRESLSGKGLRTLVLNDETHHVYNNENGDPEKPETIRKWKSFLDAPEFDFKYIIGVSGTCYVQNNYFSDVIFRYSLRQAMEENYVKSVQYVTKSDELRDKHQKWQVILNRHKEKADEIKGLGILPITIVVTQKITSCNIIADDFKEFLKEAEGLNDKQVDEKVLIIHGRSKENYRLADIENTDSKVEWVFSVSMLTEGWDVKRVFQIVPHEERAFNSKLLIAQVMGRGLRIPENWPLQAGNPKVIIFNHEAWASSVQGLVNEVLEYEKKITSYCIKDSGYNFNLLNVAYTNIPKKETIKKSGTYNLFSKGYVDLARTQAVEEKYVEYAELVSNSGSTQKWTTRVKNKTYSVDEMVDTMFERLGEEKLAADYQKELPKDKLRKIIEKSLKESGNTVITDQTRQQLLQSLGTIKRGQATIVRFETKPDQFVSLYTYDRHFYGSISASSLHKDKFIFYTPDTMGHVLSEEEQFFNEVMDPVNKYGPILVPNGFDFKTPLNFIIADSNNEQRFISELVKPENAKMIDRWVKSSSQGMYGISYTWRKGEHPKNGIFNPDFFIQVGDRIVIAEVKGDEQLHEPDPENTGKNKAALKHFEIINKELKYRGDIMRYKFTFITPTSFGPFFDAIRAGDKSIDSFKSTLDIVL